MPRFVLIAAVVMAIALVAMPAVQSSELQRPAEFVSGTATSISTGTPGSLDTTSHTDLEFRYHGEIFSVPYQKITSTATANETGRHFWKIPVPKIGKTERLLTIAYRTGDDSTASVTFKIPKLAATSLVNIIEERRSPEAAQAPLKVRQEAARVQEEEWWGNRYWRTLRNKSKWPQPSDAAQTVAPAATTSSTATPGGTKE